MTPDLSRGAAEAARTVGYVDWGAIFAGTALALALSFVLFTFGSAIGLSVTSFEAGEGASLFWVGIVTGLWFIWVAITSFGAGGYLAGRMRRPVAGANVDEVEIRDGAHGLVVWAVGALVGAVLATTGVTGVIGAAGKAAGTATQAATEAVGGDIDFLGGRLLGAGGTDAPGAREDLVSVLTRSLADGQISPEDRTYAASIIAEQTGQTPEEAAAAVDAAVAQAQTFYQEAVEAAETARVATAIGAFVVAATLLASAAAAYMAAAAGGDHRDRNVPFATFGR
jgi:hypothetical protein